MGALNPSKKKGKGVAATTGSGAIGTIVAGKEMEVLVQRHSSSSFHDLLFNIMGEREREEHRAMINMKS